MVKKGELLAALLLLPVSLLSTGCAATAQLPTAPIAHFEQEVRAFEAEVMSSYNGGDPARAASHYAEDAFVHIPGQPHATGRTRIAENIARYMQDPHFSLDYVNQRTSVSASGDLAYTRGVLKVTHSDRQTNAVRTITGNYLLVMRRNPNSGWEVVEDISF